MDECGGKKKRLNFTLKEKGGIPKIPGRVHSIIKVPLTKRTPMPRTLLGRAHNYYFSTSVATAFGRQEEIPLEHDKPMLSCMWALNILLVRLFGHTMVVGKAPPF